LGYIQCIDYGCSCRSGCGCQSGKGQFSPASKSVILKNNQHGSKAATSTSGSADLLLSLDCRLAFPPSEIPKFLPNSPFLFLFAPHYHPALAHIAPIRRSLNFRSIFNILGPLINPAQPSRMLLGVAKRELGDTFAEVLRLLGVERGLVVCGKEGLDEISPEGETWVSLTVPLRLVSCSSGEDLVA
jgi:anthranilate phosphoribosyltransferase